MKTKTLFLINWILISSIFVNWNENKKKHWNQDKKSRLKFWNKIVVKFLFNKKIFNLNLNFVQSWSKIKFFYIPNVSAFQKQFQNF